MKRPLAIAFAAALLEAGPLAGASATASLSVSVTVSSNCQLSASSVAFGTYDPVVANFAAPVTGTGGVTITCTRGTAASLTLGPGANPSGSTRRMRGRNELHRLRTLHAGSREPGRAVQLRVPEGVGCGRRPCLHALFRPQPRPQVVQCLRSHSRSSGRSRRRLLRCGRGNGQLLRRGATTARRPSPA